LLPPIHLSLKEVSGLAARVLTSALMPAGAIGAAAEAVEFLELTGRGGLAALDAEKEQLLSCTWTNPRIPAEEGGVGLCDLGDAPAHAAVGPVADWLAALVAQHGVAAVALQGGRFPRMFDALGYFLAGRGLAGLVLVPPPAGAGEGSLVAVTQGDDGWAIAREPVAEQPATRGAADLRASLHALRTAKIQPSHRAGPGILRNGPWGDGVTAVCLAWRRAAGEDRPEGASVTDAGRYAGLKRRILARGWAIERSLWESLMRFADRSLIRSSDRSRLGAG
jgi:hypothetical protein